MGFRATIVRPFAKAIARSINRWAAEPLLRQERVLEDLLKNGASTAFGADYKLGQVRTYDEFKQAVPIRDYEDLKPYVERIKHGESNVLWPGKPAYFAKTSGTTSGVKYIPMSKESTPLHFGTARDASFNYFARTGNGNWLDGKMIFLSGSPELNETAGIPTGRLSGISNHLVPGWLRTNQLPSWRTNCIDDWEEKLDRIVDETVNSDMRLISGIPPWVQMYYERLLERTGKKTVKEVFPNFSLFVYGGVNFEPYRAKLESLVGGHVDNLETYPASEGFIAFQDTFPAQGLLLNVDAGMFFEFVPAGEIFNPAPTRLRLHDVELGVNYALIMHTNAGLWGYNIGDTVQFVSKNPYRIVVSGRVKHFISAFGEHVIGKEVEEALLPIANDAGVRIVEFSVAPQVNPAGGGLPYHEWFIEFDNMPNDMHSFAMEVDARLRGQNIYYDDLIAGNILKPLVITPLRSGAFRDYMKSEGKLGGQNKVPRLSNDRKIADVLSTMRFLFFFLVMFVQTALFGQNKAPILVADQTFKVEGINEFTFALAEGDIIDFHVEVIGGRRLKAVEILRYPNEPIFRSYELDTALQKKIEIQQTDVYMVRIQESGLSKKVCRFTLYRTPASAQSQRMDTRLSWDLKKYPRYVIRQRQVLAGKRTEMVPAGGQVTVPGSNMYTKSPMNHYQFTLPPHTVRWAYRVSVGQAAIEARKKDAEKLSQMLKTSAAKALVVEPHSALAAFALGMAINMTTSSAGEDVEYALVDHANLALFYKKEKYQSFMQQGAITVDAQKRYNPTSGTLYFAFRNNNWVESINVLIDVEAVTEIPLYETEIYFEPVRP